MMRVYLCGPINGRPDAECKNWRTFATDYLGADRVLDPMRRDYRGRESDPGIEALIVEQDKSDIQKCSDMLVYFDGPSVGTSMEILYGWQLGLRILVVNSQGKTLSPWLLYHSRDVFADLDSALAALLGSDP